MFNTKFLFGALLASCATAAMAANPGLDPRFGSGGAELLGPTPVSGLVMSRVSAIALQGDGKVLIAGRSIDTTDNTYLPALGRLNIDGSWDTTFANHGLFVLPFGSGSAPFGGDLHNVLFSSSGAILVAGGTYGTSKTLYRTCTLLMEFDSDGGVLLPDFGGKGTGGNFCFDFAPQTGSDNNGHFEGIVFAADDSFYMTTPRTNLSTGAVAHFDSSGIVDSSYGNNGAADIPFFGSLITLQNGKVIVAGVTDLNASIAVARLDAQGSLDTGYGNNGVYITDTQPAPGGVLPMSTVIDAVGNLLISDNDIPSDGTYAPYDFARVTSGGATDTTFNPSGQQPGAPGFAKPPIGTTNNDYVVSAQPIFGGAIFAAGTVNDAANSSTNIALLHLNANSSFDTRYGDSAHPGWSSINVGAASSPNFTTALAANVAGGLAYVATSATDTAGHTCATILRIETDDIFANGFETVSQVCPQ